MLATAHPQKESELLGSGTNSLFFYKEQSTKRQGSQLSLEEQQRAGPGPWLSLEEVLAATPRVNRIQGMASQVPWA